MWSLRLLCFCALGHSAGLFVSRSEVYSRFFCKPHNSRDLSLLAFHWHFASCPLRVQSGRCGHFVLSLGTVRFKQPGMRPTPVPQKKKTKKVTPNSQGCGQPQYHKKKTNKKKQPGRRATLGPPKKKKKLLRGHGHNSLIHAGCCGPFCFIYETFHVELLLQLGLTRVLYFR